MNVPKIRFRDFNNDYISRKLSDISELTSSKRIYLSDYVSDGIPFYRGKEITELKANKNVSDLLYITKEKYNEIKIKYGVPEKNDILITGVGTLGNIYRVPNDNPFYFKDGNLIWLKNIKENSKYIEYNLERNKRKILDSAIGSTQKALTIVGLSKLEFNFPSLNEQTKVSNFLSLIDKKIELQSKKIEDLKLFKKGLIKRRTNRLKTICCRPWPMTNSKSTISRSPIPSRAKSTAMKRWFAGSIRCAAPCRRRCLFRWQRKSVLLMPLANGC